MRFYVIIHLKDENQKDFREKKNENEKNIVT